MRMGGPPGGGGGRWGGVGPRKPKDMRTAFRKSAQWAKPLLPILLFGLVCTMAGVWLMQQPPRVIQYTIDTVIGGDNYHLLTRVVLLYIGIIVFSQAIGSLSGYWMSVAGQRLLRTLRLAIYDHFQALSLGYYDDQRVGDLTSRVTGDVNQLQNLIVNTSNSLARQVFGVGFAFFYMCTYSWQLALLVLIPIPILGIGLFVFTRRVRVVYRSIREAMGQLSAKIMENLSGMRVIKAFNRETEEHDAVASTTSYLLQQNVRAGQSSPKRNPKSS